MDTSAAARELSAMAASTVLIVDDEKNILLTLTQSLKLEGYQTEVAGGGQLACDLVAGRPIDAVLMDVKMPDMDGLVALQKIHQLRPGLPVIMMSGHGTIDTAVKATQMGALDFLEKPISRDRLLLALRNALQLQAVVDELTSLKQEVGRFEMVGSSLAMQRIYGLIQRTAPSEGRVLITGENGSGKELIARAIHAHSRRRNGPFVKLNCAAVPQELIESELFGHEKGAFTGALTARRGKFELAHQGTLFLDEVGDMPPSMQAKLLRVLQEGELERVGAQDTIQVDVRVIAATNKNLEEEIKRGKFREDLYFRLNVVQIHSPALRDRREDIRSLVDAFLGDACRQNGRRLLKLSPEAYQRLDDYDFPGNVRELKNLVERLVILSEGPVVSGAEAEALLPKSRHAASAGGGGGGMALGDSWLPPTETASVPVPLGEGSSITQPQKSPALLASPRFRADRPFRDQVEEAEREIILGALAYTKDNATEAARLLDLERGHFYKKMKSLGLRRAGGETSTSPTEPEKP